jgi:hypothetical protein
MMLHPVMASALASEHRHDMITQASKAALGAEAGRGSQDARRCAAASPRGPRRRAPRAYRRGGLLPRYRVSWSRTTLSPAGAGGRGRSWVIVISATRGG